MHRLAQPSCFIKLRCALLLCLHPHLDAVVIVPGAIVAAATRAKPVYMCVCIGAIDHVPQAACHRRRARGDDIDGSASAGKCIGRPRYQCRRARRTWHDRIGIGPADSTCQC